MQKGGGKRESGNGSQNGGCKNKKAVSNGNSGVRDCSASFRKQQRVLWCAQRHN